MLGKALSGGFFPVSAVLCDDEVNGGGGGVQLLLYNLSKLWLFITMPERLNTGPHLTLPISF